MTFDDAMDHALTLDGADRSTSYGQPAAKANGNTFLNVGHEPDTSFVLHLDRDLIEMLTQTHPATFWQTAHYQGYPAVLVRYDAPDEALVREMIERAHARAAARPRPRSRTPRARA